MEKLHSLPEVIDENTKPPTIGSIPKTESMGKQQYYANKSNMVWKIIYSLFDTEYDDVYENRLEFSKNKNIGFKSKIVFKRLESTNAANAKSFE